MWPASCPQCGRSTDSKSCLGENDGECGLVVTQTMFTADPGWLPFHSSPSKPQFELPLGSIDTHCHVFGPGNEFPYAPERKYTPVDAGKDDLWALRDHLGIERSVIVQATCHGTDNRALCDAIAHSGGRARGVASVASDIGDDELSALHDSGIRGVRFNFVRRLADPGPLQDYQNLATRLQSLNWHIVIYFEAQDLGQYRDFFSALPVPVVVDHMGRPDLAKDPDGDEFASFIRFMDENENAYCKVTCPDRLSIVGPPTYEDFIPFARKIVECFPDRVLWGTDWPHPNLKSHMPDDGHLVDMIPRIATTSALQMKLLVENPQRLYWPNDI